MNPTENTPPELMLEEGDEQELHIDAQDLPLESPTLCPAPNPSINTNEMQ